MTAESEQTRSARQENFRRIIFNRIVELSQEGKINWDFTNYHQAFFGSAITGEYKGLSLYSTDIQDEGCCFGISLIEEDGNKEAVSFSRQDAEEIRDLIIKSHSEALKRKMEANPDFYRALQEKKDAEKTAEEAKRKEQERKEQERDLKRLSEVVSLLEKQE